MCGLFGVIGCAGHDTDLPKAMEILGYLSEYRGRDSFGMCGVEADKALYTLVKKAWPASAAVGHPSFSSLFSRANGFDMLLGHTRAATRGVVSDANAHPFVVSTDKQTIVLTHNGYVNDWDKSFGVDSHWLAQQVLEKGSDVLKEITGEYALAWYDFSKRRAYLARNTKRTLFCARIRAGAARKIVYASELGMLKFALEHKKIVVEGYYELDPHMLYTFDVSNSNLVGAEAYTPAPEKKTYTYGASVWEDGSYASRGNSTTTTGTVSAPKYVPTCTVNGCVFPAIARTHFNEDDGNVPVGSWKSKVRTVSKSSAYGQDLLMVQFEGDPTLFGRNCSMYVRPDSQHHTLIEWAVKNNEEVELEVVGIAVPYAKPGVGGWRTHPWMYVGLADMEGQIKRAKEKELAES